MRSSDWSSDVCSSDLIDLSIAQTSKRVRLDKEQLGRHLAEHTAWIESGGRSGRRAELTDCDLTGVDFTGANLSAARLDRAVLAAARLGKALLLAADLRGANLVRADQIGRASCRDRVCQYV